MFGVQNSTGLQTTDVWKSFKWIGRNVKECEIDFFLYVVFFDGIKAGFEMKNYARRQKSKFNTTVLDTNLTCCLLCHELVEINRIEKDYK